MRKMFVLIAAVMLCVSTSTAGAAGEQWSKYVPEKERKQISKGASKIVAGFGSSERAIVSWVTEPLARAMVSQIVDRQRLQAKDAESRYNEIRPDGRYTFIIRVWFSGEHLRPFGPHKARDLANPLEGSTMFLQRADDSSNFARATAEQTEFDLYDGPTEYSSRYLVRFAKTNDDGKPVVRSLDDAIELQMEIAGKKSKVKYSIKEVVSSLGDL